MRKSGGIMNPDLNSWRRLPHKVVLAAADAGMRDLPPRWPEAGLQLRVHPPDCLGGVLHSVLGLLGHRLVLQEGTRAGECVVGSGGGGGAAVGTEGGGHWRAAGPAPPTQDRASVIAAAAAHPRCPNGARTEGRPAADARPRRRNAGRVQGKGDLGGHDWVLVACLEDVWRKWDEKMIGGRRAAKSSRGWKLLLSVPPRSAITIPLPRITAPYRLAFISDRERRQLMQVI